jgi:hypothetical protein
MPNPDRPGTRSPRTAEQTSDVVRPERGDRVWLGAHGNRRELRSRSRRGARALAWATLAVVAVGTALWARTAWALLAPCERVDVPVGGECVAETAWIWRAIQLPIALAGIIIAVVGIVYLAHFAITGRTFRYWRGVARTFAAVVIAWLAVFVIGTLDATHGEPQSASGNEQHPVVSADIGGEGEVEDL